MSGCVPKESSDLPIIDACLPTETEPGSDGSFRRTKIVLLNGSGQPRFTDLSEGGPTQIPEESEKAKESSSSSEPDRRGESPKATGKKRRNIRPEEAVALVKDFDAKNPEASGREIKDQAAETLTKGGSDVSQLLLGMYISGWRRPFLLSEYRP